MPAERLDSQRAHTAIQALIKSELIEKLAADSFALRMNQHENNYQTD